MTDVAWATLRDRAIRGFNGELPNAQTEQDLIDAFQASPAAVSRSLDEVVEQHQAGKARSGWAVWRSRASAVHGSSTVTARLDDGRDRRVANAEQWIRNAGVHFDTQAEVEDELFGDLGRLRDWANDDLLRERLVRLWREQRPRGERCELEQHGRAEGWKRTRAAVAAAGKTRPAERERESTIAVLTAVAGDADADADIPI